MSNNFINDSLVWALSEEARQELYRLINSGIDFDLAYAILEERWPEEELYSLPPKGDGDEAA
jgi:hypothetical protein